MTLLGNAVQLNKFSLAQCDVVGKKQDSRKERGKKDEIIYFNRVGIRNKDRYTQSSDQDSKCEF